MRLVAGPGEDVGTYRSIGFGSWLGELIAYAGHPAGRPRIIAIDGRGGAGKSSLTRRIADVLPETAVVHTDDLAWNFSIFGWGEFLTERILLPLRNGEPVDVQPPGWAPHGRTGSVTVPVCETVLVEGTGSFRLENADLYDASVWVQSDFDEAKRRALDRDVEQGVNGDREAATRFWDEWMLEEIPFYLGQRPWDRADTVVAGTDVVPLESGDLAVSRMPLTGGE